MDGKNILERFFQAEKSDKDTIEMIDGINDFDLYGRCFCTSSQKRDETVVKAKVCRQRHASTNEPLNEESHLASRQKAGDLHPRP